MLGSGIRRAELLTEAEQVPVELGRAFEVWRSATTADEVPCWSIRRLLDFPSVLASWAMVFVHEPGPGDLGMQHFRVQYWGSSWTPFFGRDLTGQLVSSVGGPGPGEPVGRACALVCETGQPFVLHAAFEDAAGADCSYYRIALPFRRAGSTKPDVAVVLSDPGLITRQLCQAWDVPPPLSLVRRTGRGRSEAGG